MSHGPRPCGKGWVRIPDHVTDRVRRVAARLGVMRARIALGVGLPTLEEFTTPYGRTQPVVIARVIERLDALERQEAGAA